MERRPLLTVIMDGVGLNPSSFGNAVSFAATPNLDFLKTQEKTANDLMSQLDTKIAEIDNKKIAVDAVRQATVLTGEEGSVNDKIEALNKEIDEMFVDVETALKVEEAKLTEMQTETSTADELLAEPTDLNATMAELDAILGTGDEGGN